ncbi:MAG: type II secretion system protein [Holophagaceae bacterium]|jgi:general secretion pathway protein G
MKITNAKGFTLLELVITATVLLILASASVPLVKNGIRRDKEIQLSRNLREIRLAIDEYRKAAEFQKIKAPPSENNLCPSTLEELTDGVAATGSTSKKIKFLRRIPTDPFTGKAEWGLRSTSDDPKSRSWGGGHIYDVYSLASGTGLNGIPYGDW